MEKIKTTLTLLAVLLISAEVSAANFGHELAKAQFHKQKQNKSSHYDMSNLIAVPELPDFAYWTRELAGQETMSRNMKKVLNYLADQMPDTQSNFKHPEVGTFSYEWEALSESNFGMSVSLQADVAVGVNLPFFSVYTDRRNLAFNPQVFIEFASHNVQVYHFGMYKIHLFVDLNLFKFIPFDYQVMISMEPTEVEGNVFDYCSGMQILTDVMDLELKMAVEVMECSFGLFGVLIGDLSDCYWKKYYLEEPLAGIHFLNALDTQNDFLQWWCNYQLRDSNGEPLNIYLGQPLNGGDKGYTNEFFAPRDDNANFNVLPPKPSFGPKPISPADLVPVETGGTTPVPVENSGSSNLKPTNG